MFKFTFVSLVSLVLLFSCQPQAPQTINNGNSGIGQSNQNGQTGSNTEQGTIPNIDGNQSSQQTCLNFQDHIGPVIQSNCLPCHSSGRTRPDLSNASNNLSFLGASIAQTIIQGTMPLSGPLSSDIRNAVQTWQTLGFPRSNSDCVSSNSGTGSSTESNQPSIGSGSGF